MEPLLAGFGQRVSEKGGGKGMWIRQPLPSRVLSGIGFISLVIVNS